MIYTLIISLLIEKSFYLLSSQSFLVSEFITLCPGGGAFDSLFCPEGRVFVHNDCPGGGFLLPSSRVPGGWLWMKLIKFTKLWQSCSNPHLKIRPIAIFAFYSLNYSLAARLQDNSRPKSPTKVETKRKLQQFTVSGWLTRNGGESGNDEKKTLRLKLHSI